MNLVAQFGWTRPEAEWRWCDAEARIRDRTQRAKQEATRHWRAIYSESSVDQERQVCLSAIACAVTSVAIPFALSED